MEEETGWLIEFAGSVQFPPMWLMLHKGQIEWTQMAHDALRFSRKIDAEAFVETFLGGKGSVGEHAWG